jgi:predicted RNA-binding protein YlxR (DUF448 family)
MRGHSDEAEDKKLFGKMLKKAMPGHKVTSHLKKDIKEQKKGIREDKKLMKSVKSRGRGY